MPFKPVKCRKVFSIPFHFQPTTKLSRFKKLEFCENLFLVLMAEMLFENLFTFLRSSKVAGKEINYI
jgi:hypothetical protein